MNHRLFQADVPFAPRRWPFFYGWMILVISTCLTVVTIPGQTMVMSVFTDLFIQAAGISRTELTYAYLVGTGLSGFLIPGGGMLLDRFGARKFTIIVLVCFGLSVWGVSGFDVFGRFLGRIVGNETWGMLAALSTCFVLIRFFGQGMLTISARTILAKWWNEKRGLVTSLSGVFVGFLFASAPLFLNWELDQFGWRGAWAFNGFMLMIVVATFAWLLVRDNPEECGLLMDGYLAGRVQKTIKNVDMVWRKDFTRREALGTYAFWVITFGISLQSLTSTAYVFHVLDIGRSQGMEGERILTFFLKSAIISIPVNLLFSYLISFIKLRYVLVLSGLGGVLTNVGILQLPTANGELMTVLGMGLGWGAFAILIAVSYARFFGREHLGAINGVAMSMIVWGSAIGPVLYSTIQDCFGNYNIAFWGAGGCYACVTVLAMFMENPQRKVSDMPEEGLVKSEIED